MRTILRSNTTKVFMAKIWGPILCIYAAVAVFGRDFPSRRSLMMIPFLIAALFGSSVAVVEVRDGVLRFRRLFKWKTIDRKDIIGARVVWGPVLASIGLNRRLFPWGRLYFVLDGTLSNLFQRHEYRLLNYILNAKEGLSHDQSSVNLPDLTGRSPARNLIVAAVAGIVLFSLLKLLVVPALPHDPSQLAPPKWVAMLARSEVQFMFFAVFAFLAIYRRTRPEAWIFGFLAGMGLPYVVLHCLR